MNVLFLLWSAEAGGAERLTHDLAEGLQARGTPTSILLATSTGPFLTELRDSSVSLWELELDRGRDLLVRRDVLRSAIGRLGPTVVVVPRIGLPALALRLIGYRGRIVGIEHGEVLQISQARAPSQLKPSLYWHSGVTAHHDIVCVSKATQAAVQSRLRLHRRKPDTRVIYPGVPTPPIARAAWRSGPLVVGVAARLAPGKGIDVAIRAVHRLVCQGAPVRLRIAGTGPEEARLRKLCREHGLDHSVVFAGHQQPNDFWADCHLALQPSDSWIESFGMSSLEAMARGLPVIASDQGGLREVAGGPGGHLVPPGDPDAIAAVIQTYLDQPSYLAARGAAARERALTRFTIEDTVRQFDDLVSHPIPAVTPTKS